jgi:hypothetical protein
MVENPDKFIENKPKENFNLTASELKKLKRKANKAKAVNEKDKAEQTAKQSTVFFLN